MPMVISTPERWFRTRRCDMYQFQLAQGQRDLPIDLRTWLAMNLQDPKIEILGPSEHSGWISGGGQSPTVAMTASEAQQFQDRWETPDGTSLDPRWQCYQRRYIDWLAQFEQIEVSKGRPAKDSQYRWLLCDAGLYAVQGHYKEADTQRWGVPGEPSIDDWWWSCQQFPEVHAATQVPFMMGFHYLDSQGKRNITFQFYEQRDGDARFTISVDWLKNQNTFKEQVRVALGCPDETPIHFGFF